MSLPNPREQQVLLYARGCRTVADYLAADRAAVIAEAKVRCAEQIDVRADSDNLQALRAAQLEALDAILKEE